jgi:hypothetical protein
MNAFYEHHKDSIRFYINDARWGRMFVRVCPYFPFTARVV